MIRRAHIVKKKATPYRLRRAKRDLYKAWMYPVRFIREVFRWSKRFGKIMAFLYRVLTGKQHFTWDG